MNSIRNFCLSALVLFMPGFASLAPAIVVSSNATPPTSNVLVDHFAASDSFAESWQWTANTGNSHRDVGQSFLVPGTGTVLIDAVTLRARDVGTSVAGSPFHLEIWTVADPFDNSGDLLVSSEAGVLPASGLAPSSYWTFDIAPVALSGGDYYAFVLSFDTGPDAQRSVAFVEDFNSGYPQGRWVARNGTPTTWSTITNDAVFVIQFAPVPEPATGSLLLAASAVMLLSHRRGRKP